MHVLLTLLSLAFAGQSTALKSQIPLLNITRYQNIATFKQFVDHKDHSLGTFPQRYQYSTTFWNGPGSPVVFTTPGEAPMSPEFLFGNSTFSHLAQSLGAAMVQLEHRYFGESIPRFGRASQPIQPSDLNPDTLQYLTVQNAIADFVHFAEHVSLPFDAQGTSRASKAPWVFIGGSYPGSLAAWTDATSPGTFWAYWASSAPVQLITDFWEYQIPVQQAMPRDCRTMLRMLVDEIDEINKGDSRQRASYTMPNGTQLSDFKSLSSYFEVVMSKWQIAGPSNTFTGKFCNDLTGNTANPVVAGPTRYSLDLARQSLIEYFLDYQNRLVPLMNTNRDGQLELRAWFWVMCNEPLHLWRTATPKGLLSLLPSTINVQHYEKEVCHHYFQGNGTISAYNKANKTVDNLNAWTGGWNPKSNSKRLLFVDGEFDPVREASVSSDFREGGPLASSDEIPVSIVPGATHCEDLNFGLYSQSDAQKKVIEANIDQIGRWVQQWYTQDHEGQQKSQQEKHNNETSKQSPSPRPDESHGHSGSNSTGQPLCGPGAGAEGTKFIVWKVDGHQRHAGGQYGTSLAPRQMRAVMSTMMIATLLGAWLMV